MGLDILMRVYVWRIVVRWVLRLVSWKGGAIVTDLYVMGYSEALLRIQRARNSADWCGYLNPHLKPGLRALDVGCGPGAISVGLAQAIAPGELRGIDIAPSQVELAAQAAAEFGLSNAKFSVADAAALPFEDALFDIVHCSDTLAFLPDAATALDEMKRVLKPGGILGCREIIMDSFLIHPDPEPNLLARGYAVFADILEADGGRPQMGKELADRMEQAGFTDIRVSASFDVFAGQERLKLFYDLGQDWYFTDAIQLPATQYGAAAADMLEEIRLARDRWYLSTGAMAAFAYGEALGVSP